MPLQEGQATRLAGGGREAWGGAPRALALASQRSPPPAPAAAFCALRLRVDRGGDGASPPGDHEGDAGVGPASASSLRAARPAGRRRPGVESSLLLAAAAATAATMVGRAAATASASARSPAAGLSARASAGARHAGQAGLPV
jgi:hypothetical protein